MLLVLSNPRPPGTLLYQSLPSSHQRRKQRPLLLADGIPEFFRITCSSLSLWKVGTPLGVIRGSQCHPIPILGQVLLLSSFSGLLFCTYKIEIQTLVKEFKMLDPGRDWLSEDACRKCGMNWAEGTDFEGADWKLGFEQGDSRFWWDPWANQCCNHSNWKSMLCGGSIIVMG